MIILSLGAGVQSSTLALMAAAGDIGPMPDAAIFADTHGEPKAVYEWLNWLEKQLPFPVYRASRGSLWQSASTVRRTRDGQRTYVPTGIPVFMVEGLVKAGIGKRQCTRDFKVDVITKEARRLLGKIGKRITKAEGTLISMWIGISTDESQRVKESRQSWIKARWPLLETGHSRASCLAWMKARGFPIPPRSACTYCPYHDDRSWLELAPEEFADAVLKEKQLQAAYADTTEIRGVPYFHSSRVPLDQVVFKPKEQLPAHPDLFDENTVAVECEGMCGL